MWSPDGKSIAFVHWKDSDAGVIETSINIMVADGSGSRVIGDGPGEDLAASWSPDGRRVAFMNDRYSTDTASIYITYVVDAEGGEERRLTNLFRNEDSFARSPDGNSIAFERGTFDKSSVIVVLDLRDDIEQLVSPRGGYDVSQGWSPVGKQLVFTRGNLSEETLWFMDADGTDQHRINGDFTEPSLGVDWAPAPSE